MREVVMPSLEEAIEILSAAGMTTLPMIQRAHDEATKWQEKVTLFETLNAFIESHEPGVAGKCAGAVVAVLKAKTRDFKASNFNIINAV